MENSHEECGSRPSGAAFKIFPPFQSVLLLTEFDPGSSMKQPRLKFVQTGSSPPPALIYIIGGVTPPDEFYFSLKTAFPEYFT